MSNIYRLDQTFTHSTASHEFRIQWTRIGNSSLPPLIFVHGTPWANFVWHDLAASLSTRYSIYLFDHPGFADSPSPRRLVDAKDNDRIDLDPSLKLRAEAAAALIQHWQLKSPPHVIAHDNGGLVSLRLLLQHNIQFKSLCLIDVVAIGPFGLPLFELAAGNEDVFNSIPDQFIEGFVRAYVRSATYKPMSKEIEDLLSAQWVKGGSQGPNRFIKELVQAHNRDVHDVEGEYGRVKELVPVKIIWGEQDSWLPVEIAGRLADTLKAEEVVIVPQAAHLIHYDQPSRLALEVGLWLEKQNQRH